MNFFLNWLNFFLNLFSSTFIEVYCSYVNGMVTWSGMGEVRCSALTPSWETELTTALTVLVTVVAVVCVPVTITISWIVVTVLGTVTGVRSLEPGAWSPAFPLGTRFGYTGGTPVSKPRRTGASLLLLFFFPFGF